MLLPPLAASCCCCCCCCCDDDVDDGDDAAAEGLWFSFSLRLYPLESESDLLSLALTLSRTPVLLCRFGERHDDDEEEEEADKVWGEKGQKYRDYSNS